MQVHNLRVEIGGFPGSDYRIHEGNLEFRTFTLNGESHQNNRSTWRRLTPNEIALHFRLDTIIGRWFQDKVTDWRY